MPSDSERLVDGVGVFLAVVAQVEAREREPERVDLADQRVHVGLGDHFGVVPPEVVCEDPQVLTQRLGILIPAGTDVGDAEDGLAHQPELRWRYGSSG